jgi:LCP family protein required for cell wall assembly
MAPTCPRCHTQPQPGDQFCSTCGTPLADETTLVEPAPVPWASGFPDQQVRRRRKRVIRRPWYRRKLVLIPLTALIVLGVVTAGSFVYLDTRFDTINSISTPPPAITGDQLGGDEDLVIDTGPAQEAIRQAQQGAPTPTATAVQDASAAKSSSGDESLRSNQKAAPAIQLLRQATPVPEVGDAQIGTPEAIRLPPSETGVTINVLLIGVDARPGEAIDVGVRADILVALNLDPETGSCRMVSIPRDSRVELPGYGLSKINHSLAIGGIPYQLLVTENLLGISFDHYGLIDFAGAKGIVDALGGITVVNDRMFSHSGYTFDVGELRLNGDEAVAYSRFRYDEQGDFGRQERQQQVVRAMLTEGADLDVVTAIPRLLDTVEDHVRTDAGPRRLIELGRRFHPTCTGETLATKRIPGEIATLNDEIFNQPLSFVVLDVAEVTEKVKWLLSGDEPEIGPAAATPAALEEDGASG